MSMAIMAKRWYRSRRNVVILCVVAALCVVYYVSPRGSPTEPDLDITRSLEHVDVPRRIAVLEEMPSLVPEPATTNDRSKIIEYIENKLEEALKLDQGTGCEMPQLDPFAEEVTKFDVEFPPIKCSGRDWVKCYHSRCRVVDEVKEKIKDINCKFQDILYHSDQKYTIGPATYMTADGSHILVASDHVKVSCTGISVEGGGKAEWAGNTLGFRAGATAPPVPPGRADSYNVLIFGFDSTARNGFIRRMPKSWKVLTEELKATVMEGYNVVGDGTPAALFPILTGRTELELPDVRRSARNHATLDTFPFIFYKLKEDGYRTAYFEDMPQIGTFQYRFNGWRRQPADHYLRAFYLEEQASARWWKGKRDKYCVGDTPQYKLMMNITEQFMELDGKRFAFTFIADITHDDFNMIQSADEDTVAFLRSFKKYAEDTFLVVMGDHGPRYAKVRDTLQGKLEERLPLLALLPPAALLRARPAAAAALRDNARALTTPHDLHATLLDALGLAHLASAHRVRGADLPRALSLLQPVPRNRSCSAAGVEPHWCACVAWQPLPAGDALAARAARALLDHINGLLEPVSSQCAPRTLTSVEWVLRQRPNSRLLAFSEAKDTDGYVGKFNAQTKVTSENYQVKLVAAPGRGVFEASLTLRAGRFVVHSGDISRTNAYGLEPDCISKTHPHLNSYCYCRQ